MTEQQYTCPYCHKDYTRFTISEHYECGGEPLETVEDIKQEIDAISEEVATEESQQFTPEEIESSETEQKPAPKKRGPKPKAKVAA
jgi:hypothetical protein